MKFIFEIIQKLQIWWTRLCGILGWFVICSFREVLDVQPEDVREFAAGVNLASWKIIFRFLHGSQLKKEDWSYTKRECYGVTNMQYSEQFREG